MPTPPPPEPATIARLLAASPRWLHRGADVGTPSLLAFGLGLTGGTWVVDVDHRGSRDGTGTPGRVRVVVKRDERARVDGEVVTRRRLGPLEQDVMPVMLAPDPSAPWRPTDDHPTIVLAHVADARPGDVLAGCTAVEAVGIVDAIAAVHAATWACEAGDAPVWSPRLPTSSQWAVTLTGLAREFPALVGTTIPARLESLPASAATARDRLLSGPRCWIHGDLHLDNVLHRTDGSAVLLDWTHGAVGPPAVDLARLLVEGPHASTVPPDELLGSWFAAMARHGIEGAATTTIEDVDAALDVLTVGVVRWAARELAPDAHPRMALLRERAVRHLLARLTPDPS